MTYRHFSFMLAFFSFMWVVACSSQESPNAIMESADDAGGTHDSSDGLCRIPDGTYLVTYKAEDPSCQKLDPEELVVPSAPTTSPRCTITRSDAANSPCEIKSSCPTNPENGIRSELIFYVSKENVKGKIQVFIASDGGEKECNYGVTFTPK